MRRPESSKSDWGSGVDMDMKIQLLPARRPATAALLILCSAFISYLTAIPNSFVYDDIPLVLSNPLVRGLDNLPEIFSTGYWTAALGQSYGLYRPLTIASFAIDHIVGGSGPLVYHLDNIFIHFLCSLLVYSILTAVLGRERPALFAAILFAVHPVHSEAVAWVSGRAEILSVLLLLLSMRVFLIKPLRPPYAFLSATIFFLAMLAKETALVLPILLAVYMLLYEPSPSTRKALTSLSARLWPFVLAVLLYFALRALVLRGEMLPPDISLPFHGIGAYQRFLTMCTAFFQYIRLGFIPTGLSAFYYFFSTSLASSTVLAFLAAIALLAALSRRLLRTHVAVIFGVAWFFIAFLPVSNIVPVGIIMSERAMYLPSVGVCLLLGLALSHAARISPRAGLGLFTAIVALFAAMTMERNPFWGDQEGFRKAEFAAAEDAVALRPDIVSNYKMLANLRVYAGMYDDDTARVIARGLELDPRDAGLHYFLGMAYEHEGRVEDALKEYETALSLSQFHEAYGKASGALRRLGRWGEAESMLDEAIRLNPFNCSYYYNKGLLRYQRGDLDAAYDLFARTASLEPDYYRAWLGMGMVDLDRGMLDRSVDSLNKALALKPDDADAHYYLASALARRGDRAAALAEADMALRLEPGHPEAKGLRERLDAAGK